MNRNVVETVMGAVVLMVAGMFVYFAYTQAEIKAVVGYEIKAAFYKIGGLSKGSDVRISGIKVGTVTNHALDSKTYDALVSMSIKSELKLPKDTVATIASGGLLGGKYVRLEPGKEKTYLEAGDMYFFNSELLHEIPRFYGNLPRIVMATFFGYSPDDPEIYVWS